MATPPQTTNVSPGLFFATREQRIALARQRFFDEGVRPSGLVSEAVIQSWARCVQRRLTPEEARGFAPVTRSRVHSVLSRNRLLVESADNEMLRLEAALAGTGCRAILTDWEGIVLQSSRSVAANAGLMKLITRVGVDLGEESAGTTAPGTVAHTGQPCTILAEEHFFGGLGVMRCAAAPIRDMHGQVAGVLDLSIEDQSFRFDAAGLVSQYAIAIENRLLEAQSDDHIVLRLQVTPDLIGTSMEGLAGVASDGRLAWVNGAAARLLGVPQTGPHHDALSDIFGLGVSELAVLTRRSGATTLRLPSGLTIWASARMQGQDGTAHHVYALGELAETPQAVTPLVQALTAAGVTLPSAAGTAPAADTPALPAVAAAAAAENLRDAQRQLILQTVATCGGNVSKAARILKVSRGLIYRHLQPQ